MAFPISACRSKPLVRPSRIPSGDIVTGLVAHWSFGEGAGDVAHDISGNGNHVGLYGATWAAGPAGGALAFDGVDDGAWSVDQIAFDSPVITLAFWLSWAAYANNDDLAFELSTNFNNNAHTFIIDPNSSGGGGGSFEVYIHGGEFGYCSRRFARPSAGVFHHYVIILDNSTPAGDVTVYVDGELQATVVGDNNKSSAGSFRTDNLYLMHRADGPALHGAGTLGNVWIYNRAISSDDVAMLYAYSG